MPTKNKQKNKHCSVLFTQVVKSSVWATILPPPTAHLNKGMQPHMPWKKLKDILHLAGQTQLNQVNRAMLQPHPMHAIAGWWILIFRGKNRWWAGSISPPHHLSNTSENWSTSDHISEGQHKNEALYNALQHMCAQHKLVGLHYAQLNTFPLMCLMHAAKRCMAALDSFFLHSSHFDTSFNSMCGRTLQMHYNTSQHSA